MPSNTATAEALSFAASMCCSLSSRQSVQSIDNDSRPASHVHGVLEAKLIGHLLELDSCPARVTVTAHSITVIRSEDKDGLVLYPELLNGTQDLAHAAVDV
jgi:hypothetical protein